MGQAQFLKIIFAPPPLLKMYLFIFLWVRSGEDNSWADRSGYGAKRNSHMCNNFCSFFMKGRGGGATNSSRKLPACIYNCKLTLRLNYLKS